MRERWSAPRLDVPGLDVRRRAASQTGANHARGELRLIVRRELAELLDRSGRESRRQLVEQVFQDGSIDRQHGPRGHGEARQGDDVACEHQPRIGCLAEADIDQEERLVAEAARHGNFIRIDMEDSSLVDVTLRIYRRLREVGHHNVGTVLQSYLYRTEDDLESLLPLQPNLSLILIGVYQSHIQAMFRNLFSLGITQLPGPEQIIAEQL